MSDDEREARRKAAAQAAEQRAQDLASRGGVSGKPAKAGASEIKNEQGMMRPGDFN